MESFSQIASNKEKDRLKFKKSSFKDSTPKSGTRAIGGASPVAAASLKQIEDLTEAVGNAGSGGLTLSERLEGIEAKSNAATGNINALDTATSAIGMQADSIATSLQALTQEVAGKAVAEHEHMGTYLTQAQVTSLIVSLLENNGITEPPAVGSPTIAVGQYGRDFSYTPAWGDDFSNENAETLFNRWHPDQMVEGLHQAGNNGEPNWRWSANYSKPTETAFVTDNALHMRAHVENRPNPFRKAYQWRGQTMNPQDYWIYLSFLTTWARKYDNASDGFITDPDAPDRTWGPGSAFEWTINLEEMRTQACRISLYLLPAYENDSNSYDPNGTNGVEVDITEIEALNGLENVSQSKVISGRAAGNTPNGSVRVSDLISGINLPTGDHKFTLLWAKDKLVWYVNGIEIQRDEDPRRIPQTPHYIAMSREANSGIKPQRNDGVLFDTSDAYSDGSLQMPPDVGIFARPVYLEIDTLHNDTSMIKDFQSYSFVDNSTAGIGLGDDTSGISPSITSGNPEADFAAGRAHTFTWDANGRTVSDWCLEVGSTRGGTELTAVFINGDNRSALVGLGDPYTGPVNARLWFRASANSVWHWRDYGFDSGLQPYRVGTTGKIRATAPPNTFVGSTPTVVAGVSSGRDGKFADSVDYTGGVVPSDYSMGFTGPNIGMVGEASPDYSLNGPALRQALPNPPGLTYQQYPNVQGEFLWPSPAEGFDPAIDKYELAINGVVQQRNTSNSFLLDYLPVSQGNTANVRIVRDDGSHGPALELVFNVFEQ